MPLVGSFAALLLCGGNTGCQPSARKQLQVRCDSLAAEASRNLKSDQRTWNLPGVLLATQTVRLAQALRDTNRLITALNLIEDNWTTKELSQDATCQLALIYEARGDVPNLVVNTWKYAAYRSNRVARYTNGDTVRLASGQPEYVLDMKAFQPLADSLTRTHVPRLKGTPARNLLTWIQTQLDGNAITLGTALPWIRTLERATAAARDSQSLAEVYYILGTYMSDDVRTIPETMRGAYIRKAYTIHKSRNDSDRWYASASVYSYSCSSRGDLVTAYHLAQEAYEIGRKRSLWDNTVVAQLEAIYGKMNRFDKLADIYRLRASNALANHDSAVASISMFKLGMFALVAYDTTEAIQALNLACRYDRKQCNDPTALLFEIYLDRQQPDSARVLYRQLQTVLGKELLAYYQARWELSFGNARLGQQQLAQFIRQQEVTYAAEGGLLHYFYEIEIPRIYQALANGHRRNDNLAAAFGAQQKADSALVTCCGNRIEQYHLAQAEEDLLAANAAKVAALQEAQLASERQTRVWLTWGFGLIALGLIGTGYGYLHAQRSKRKIEAQARQLHEANEEITAQAEEVYQANQEIQAINDQLEEYNRRVGESIAYAQRIQRALLPEEALLAQLFPEHTLLYLPRDIVSGDFYWVHREDAHTIYLAVADCTGHGIPGAFMSLIGLTVLNQIVADTHIPHDPSVMLQLLHQRVREALKQHSGDSRDGMDIALIRINLAERWVEFAGANHNLVHFLPEQTEPQEFRADRQSIGGYTTETVRTFHQDRFTYVPGSRFYLFSDGYRDQFGHGMPRRKMGTPRFYQHLQTLQNLPMPEQSVYLRTAFDEWRGNTLQIDDVLVLGVTMG